VGNNDHFIGVCRLPRLPGWDRNRPAGSRQ
jgi:hypothetical protein